MTGPQQGEPDQAGQPGAAGEGTRVGPVLTSAPGEPLEVTVDLPVGLDDLGHEVNPSDEDLLAAIAEAAALVAPLLEDTDGPGHEPGSTA